MLGLVHAALWAQRRFFPGTSLTARPPPCATDAGARS
jgi:hypothetical protein